MQSMTSFSESFGLCVDYASLPEAMEDAHPLRHTPDGEASRLRSRLQDSGLLE